MISKATKLLKYQKTFSPAYSQAKFIQQQRPLISSHQKEWEQDKRTINMAFLIAPFALAIYLGTDIQSEVTECEASRADRIRGAYENKIRFFASPEKVFEVFSSIHTESGELRMSYADFLHALTPYTHGELSTCSDKYLEENNDKIKKIIDFDGDGSISFPEFVFFLTIFQLPPGILRKTFRKYEGGKMDKKQFSEELTNLRHKTLQGSKQVNKVIIDARQIAATEEDFLATNLALANRLFAKKEFVTAIDIMKLREEVRLLLWQYEFENYDPDEKETIHLSDYLRTMLSSMNGGQIEKKIKKISKITAAFSEDQQRVTFDEFLVFQHFLDNIDQLKAKISQYKYLDYDMFDQVVRSFCKNNEFCKEKKVKISETQTKAIFLLLDSDDSGELEQEEVIDVLCDRQSLGQNKEAKAKDDAKQLVQKYFKKARKLFGEVTGY